MLLAAGVGTGWPMSPHRVLLVVNTESPLSVRIGDYYGKARNIPPGNVCKIATSTREFVPRIVYEEEIRKPVSRFLMKNELQDQVLCIVTTKGVPLGVWGHGDGFGTTEASVDSELCLLYFEMIAGAVPREGRIPNPYFKSRQEVEPLCMFDHDRYSMYLVTRLTGYSWEDVKALIDRATHPAADGTFVFDLHSGGYKEGNGSIDRAASLLQAGGHKVILEKTDVVVKSLAGVMGYAAWGSNDSNRKERFLGFSWLPGAVATTFVSTNGRTFEDPGSRWEFRHRVDGVEKGEGQSLAGDFIREGVTGMAANVSEPYLDGCVRPDILFPAYVAGYTLAESYYQALPFLSWQSVIVGDPLCAPYAEVPRLEAERVPPVLFEKRLAAFRNQTSPGSPPAQAPGHEPGFFGSRDDEPTARPEGQ